MPRFSIVETKNFKKTKKLAMKRGRDIRKLDKIVELLVNDIILPAKYRDHALVTSRNYSNCRECHISPDWLLVYRKENDFLILTLVATGSHSDLFKE